MFLFVNILDLSAQKDIHSTSFESINKAYKTAIAENDSIGMIHRLLDFSNKNRTQGDYDLAFDHLWDALLICEQQPQTEELLVPIYRGLGVLYDIYNKDSLALNHLQKSLSISKKLITKKAIKKHQIVSTYYSMATFWRDRKDYQRALYYLDSCNIVYQSTKTLPYVLTDRGYCNLQLGNLSIAEKYLFEAKPLLEKENAPYLVWNLSFIGDFKKEQFDYDRALTYYKQALELLERRKVHFELKPSLLEKIAEIYIIKGDLLKGIAHTRASKQSFEELFSATNKRSHRLFEIKNKYKVELAENEKEIYKQTNLVKEKSKYVTRLMLLFAFTLLAGIGFYLVYIQRNKIKKLSLIRELDNEKNKAILEVKSKELTAYALKMIEKEDAVQALLEVIEEADPEKHKKLKTKYTTGQDNSWKEFNQRFTEVNVDFYESLCKKHPDLSSTELKHCALIKLNFNSHEMARILHISLRSVHTSRYRIRKKMNLDSNSSLTSYIGSI